MRKAEFQNSPNIKSFIKWIEPLLSTKGAFTHNYYHRDKKESFTFDNLYSAYKNYDWKPIDKFADDLKKSIDCNDDDMCLKACLAVLDWGNVSFKGNNNRVTNMLKPSRCAYFRGVKERLALNMKSNDYFYTGFHITSGFSKIYSAYVDDFIIYDSRVAAAFGLFAREYCKNINSSSVPVELQFAWTAGRDTYNRRNPCDDNYKFPKLYIGKKYLENNIRANWLVSLIANETNSAFNSLDMPFRMRAIEQSLFEIGYDISSYNHIK